eukprot:9792134-Lingulodinium_polyedra.AAC.1
MGPLVCQANTHAQWYARAQGVRTRMGRLSCWARQSDCSGSLNGARSSNAPGFAKCRVHETSKSRCVSL